MSSATWLNLSSGGAGEELQDLRETLREFWRAAVALGTQLFRLVLGILRLTVPWLLTGTWRTWNWFCGFPVLHQVAILSATLCGVLAVHLWRSGAVQRCHKAVRTRMRSTRAQIQQRIDHVRSAVKRGYNKLVRVGTVGLPGLAVTVPLRLYTSRPTFRQFVSLLVTLSALLHSVKALVSFYNNEKAEAVESAATGKRGTTTALSGSRRRGTRTSRSQQEGDSNSSSGGSEGVACWLNYFVLAEVLDWLVAAVLSPCTRFWGKAALQLETLQHGALIGYSIMEHAWKDLPVLGSIVNRGGKASGHSAVGEAIGALLEFGYALCFMMLMMHAMNNNRKDLMGLTQRLVMWIDVAVQWLIGKPLLEDPPEVVAARRRASIGLGGNTAAPGLLPQMWAVAKVYLPSPIVSLVNYLCYVPQLLLLLLPGVLLGPAYIFISSLFPLYYSYRALSERDSSRQAYYLVYFTLFTALELTVMRWLREQGLWRLLPFQRHRDVLYITALQLLCNSPHVITQFIAAKLSRLQSTAPPVTTADNQTEGNTPSQLPSASTTTPAPVGTGRASLPPYVHIKQERVSSDDDEDDTVAAAGNRRPVRRRAVPTSAPSASATNAFRTSLFTQQRTK